MTCHSHSTLSRCLCRNFSLVFRKNIFSVHTQLVYFFATTYRRSDPGKYHPLDYVTHHLWVVLVKTYLPISYMHPVYLPSHSLKKIVADDANNDASVFRRQRRRTAHRTLRGSPTPPTPGRCNNNGGGKNGINALPPHNY